LEKKFLEYMDKGKKVNWREEGDRFFDLGEYERAIECYNVAWLGKGEAC
jgi:hypothetical protein